MSGPLSALLVRELRLAARIGGGGAMGLVFFLMLVTTRLFRSRTASNATQSPGVRPFSLFLPATGKTMVMTDIHTDLSGLSSGTCWRVMARRERSMDTISPYDWT